MKREIRITRKSVEPVIDLTPRPFAWTQAHGRHICGYSRLSVMKGYGDNNFQFPTVIQLVNGSLAYVAGPDAAKRRVEEGDNGEGDDQDEFITFAQRLEAAEVARACDEGDNSEPGKTCPVDDGTALSDALLRVVGKPVCGSGIAVHASDQASSVIPVLPAEQSSGVDATLYWLTEGLREFLYEGRFDAIIAERFDPLKGSVN